MIIQNILKGFCIILVSATAINLAVASPADGQNYPHCTQKCGNEGNEGGGGA